MFVQKVTDVVPPFSCDGYENDGFQGLKMELNRSMKKSSKF